MSLSSFADHSDCDGLWKIEFRDRRSWECLQRWLPSRVSLWLVRIFSAFSCFHGPAENWHWRFLSSQQTLIDSANSPPSASRVGPAGPMRRLGHKRTPRIPFTTAATGSKPNEGSHEQTFAVVRRMQINIINRRAAAFIAPYRISLFYSLSLSLSLSLSHWTPAFQWILPLDSISLWVFPRQFARIVRVSWLLFHQICSSVFPFFHFISMCSSLSIASRASGILLP